MPIKGQEAHATEKEALRKIGYVTAMEASKILGRSSSMAHGTLAKHGVRFMTLPSNGNKKARMYLKSDLRKVPSMDEEKSEASSKRANENSKLKKIEHRLEELTTRVAELESIYY
jgi:hypothetical protein